MDFPDLAAFNKALVAEAGAAAKQLGHNLSGWSEDKNTWAAKCMKCGDGASVKRRGLSAEIGGAATTLRCRK